MCPLQSFQEDYSAGLTVTVMLNGQWDLVKLSVALPALGNSEI